MCHKQTSNEEAYDGNQWPVLQIAQPTDGMTRSTAIGISCAKTNEETTEHHKYESSNGKDLIGPKNLLWDIAGTWMTNTYGL